jgi:hypothetical protein
LYSLGFGGVCEAYVVLKYWRVRSVKTQQFIVEHISVATSFDLQSHHQVILTHISIGTLRSSAHFWDPKMFTIIRNYGYKCSGIYGNMWFLGYLSILYQLHILHGVE